MMGTTDDAYKIIIGRLYDGIVKDPKAATVSNRIAYAEKLCGMMGKELPAQLKSADAVISFLTLQANEEGLLEKKVGDTVFRIGDGKVVVITATDGTSFNCVDPATGQFVGIYSDKDLYKVMEGHRNQPRTKQNGLTLKSDYEKNIFNRRFNNCDHGIFR